MSKQTILTIYTTITGKAEADKLVKDLLEEKAIACGVSWPVDSQYNWQGEPVKEGEFVVFLKTSSRLEEKLFDLIEKKHPYDTPAILMNEVKANKGYFEWVEEVVSSK